MNLFLKQLSEQYSKDILLLLCDRASWHTAKGLEVPENVYIFHIPPYTPEMNPIEQIWKQVRQMGFGNRIFKCLEAVVDQLCISINQLTKEMVKSITHRDWLIALE